MPRRYRLPDFSDRCERALAQGWMLTKSEFDDAGCEFHGLCQDRNAPFVVLIQPRVLVSMEWDTMPVGRSLTMDAVEQITDLAESATKESKGRAKISFSNQTGGAATGFKLDVAKELASKIWQILMLEASYTGGKIVPIFGKVSEPDWGEPA